MAPSAALARESPTSRWLRRSAPFWILLAIALLVAIPGVLTGPHERDSAASNMPTRPVDQFAWPDGPRPQPRQMTASGAAR